MFDCGSVGLPGMIRFAFTYCLCFVVVNNGYIAYSYAAARAKVYTEQDTEFWIKNAKDTVTEKVKYVNKKGVAKNIIMFLGDGMSLTTLTASRIYKGQLEKRSGENEFLSFEKFPIVGMSKTYCVNKQVADSACSATAYLSGVKNNYETIGVTAAVKKNDCFGSLAPENRTHSIAEWSMAKGKAVGLVTTTRVTHASPSGLYTHTASRLWESDADMARSNLTDIGQCEDIGKQLVTQSPGKDIKVILGGGRSKFLVNPNKKKFRKDMDLVKLWTEDKDKRFGKDKTTYVENRDQLLNIDSSKTEFLLGLFEDEHMKYRLNADSDLQPTLAEMTKKAVEVLSKEKNGFFLFVEGGLIDMAHHETFSRLSLDETVEFSKAVQQAVDMTSEDDTLIVVTSDHSHTMTMAGYPERGSDILGLVGVPGDDGLPVSTLSYANGPPTKSESEPSCGRQNLSKIDMSDPNFKYPKMVPYEYETHGGEDVMVFARGPWAHLFAGNYEQNVIPLTMGFAAGVGPAAGVVDGPAAFAYSGSPTGAVSSPLLVVLSSLSLMVTVILRVYSR